MESQKIESQKIYRLTKYERAKVIGNRATQLSRGAKPMIDTTGLHDVMKIAEQELIQNKMPFIIRRPLPDGTYVDIRVSDMIVTDT